MELSSTNIATAVQLHTAQCLNTALSSLSVEFFPENTKDIDFQVKEALAKQGIACIVATPELEYQGHDMKFATYDATVELQVAENPMLNRARMRKGDLQWGTCLDVAVAGCEVLAGPNSPSFMKYVPTTITQENEGALVIARAQLETHAWPKVEPRETWDAYSADLPDASGEYVLVSDEGGVKKFEGPRGTGAILEYSVGQSNVTMRYVGPNDAGEAYRGYSSRLRPNVFVATGYDEHGNQWTVELVARDKTPHFSWQCAFQDQSVHEDCNLGWLWEDVENEPGTGNLVTNHFGSEDNQVKLVVKNLPSRPQQPDKDRFELKVGEDGELSIFDVERSSTEVVDDTTYNATLTKIQQS